MIGILFLTTNSVLKAIAFVRDEQNTSIEKWWNGADMGNLRYSGGLGKKPCPVFALSTANPACLGLV